MSSPSGSPAASPMSDLSEEQVPASTAQAATADAHAAEPRAAPHEVRATAAASSPFSPSLGPATPSSPSSVPFSFSLLSNLPPAMQEELAKLIADANEKAEKKVKEAEKRMEQAIRMREEEARQKEENMKVEEQQRKRADEEARQKEEIMNVAEQQRKRADEEARQRVAFTKVMEQQRKRADEEARLKVAFMKVAEQQRKRADEAEKMVPKKLVIAGFPVRVVAAPTITSSKAASSATKDDKFWNDDLDVFCFTTADLANSFQPIDDLPKRKITRGYTWACYDSMCAGWDLRKGPATARYSSESLLQNLVHKVALELCSTYQLPFIYHIAQNQRIPRGKPDLSLWRGSIPWVVVEVMKPRGAFEKLSWYQQMSNDLACLRLEFGVPAPIGILTTYNGWRFCWHKYATPVATARTIAEVQGFHCEVGQDDFNTLCVSPVYSVEDPNLRLLIASVFYKMLCLKPLTPSSHHMRYSREQFKTAFPGLDSDKVDVSKTAPFLTGESAKSDALYCVKTLGVGAEGETCLMADEDGACCAVKFYQFDTSDWDYDPTKSELDAMCVKACAEEHAAWVRAYGEDCGVRVAVLGKRDVLVMPLFQPITLDEWEEPGTVGIVMKHIKELSNRGARHKDIEARHVMWRDSIKQSVVLIDWGSATNIEWSRSFSEAEYCSYAKEKLQEGIVRMKEGASTRSRLRKADEADVAARAEKAVKAAKAAAAKAANAVAEAEAEQAAPEQALRRTRSATKAAVGQAAAVKAAAEEAERAVHDLEAAIETAALAKEGKEKAVVDAKAAFMDARRAATDAKAATATKKAIQRATDAAREANDAAKVAAEAERAAMTASAVLFSVSFVWTLDPVDEYETKRGCPQDKFDAAKTRVVEIDPAKLLHLRAKHRLSLQMAPVARAASRKRPKPSSQ